MSESVGLGLIGCGQIAAAHLGQTRDDPRVRWVAVQDVRAEAAAARAAEFGVPRHTTDLAELLADPEVEAVVVATPPTAHTEPVRAAFAAGKHVLVEKPAAVRAAEVETMLAAQPAGLVGACCSCRFRATDSARAAAALIAAGELGDIRRLTISVRLPAPESFDGTQPFFLHRPGWGGQGILADWGVYDLDYVLGLTAWRYEPEAILASAWRLPEPYRAVAEPANDVEVQVAALVHLTGGVTLDYRRLSFDPTPPQNRWLIEGERGTLDLCLPPGSPQVLWHRLTATGGVTETLVETADTWADIHAGPVLDFVGAILEGRPPLTSLRQALTLQRIIDGIYDSAATMYHG